MNTAAPGWRMRGMYAAHAVLLGAPTTLFGGALSLLAVVMACVALVDPPRRTAAGFAMLLWGVGGLIGLLSWLRLSVAYLLDGGRGLQDCRAAWWIGVFIGMAATLPLLVIGFQALLESPAELFAPAFWFAGPALLLPALHLLWLRLQPS